MTVSAKLLLPLPLLLPRSERPGACLPVLSVCVGGLRARRGSRLKSDYLPACLPADGCSSSSSRSTSTTGPFNDRGRFPYIHEVDNSVR
ncbi:hypothetical protein INR49_025810 [Caranx melampygus]|nr:hypothetical protein INR49_025810 [Caranx melampygus]